MSKRIGILTGGGDAPGLNAVIRAVVMTARNHYNWDVVGIVRGFDGLYEGLPAVDLLGKRARREVAVVRLEIRRARACQVAAEVRRRIRSSVTKSAS